MVGEESVSDERARRYREAAEEKTQQMLKALELHDKGYANAKIARELDLPESVIRNWMRVDR
jgi:DNA-binding NarL/FixJ family response regulator